MTDVVRPTPELAAFDEPACDICRKRAACIGAYEDVDVRNRFACSSCCGHGNEDGHCRPITDEDRQHVRRAARLASAALEAACDIALDSGLPLGSLTERLTLFYEDFRTNREAHARHAADTET